MAALNLLNFVLFTYTLYSYMYYVSAIQPYRLRTEYRVNPVGIDELNPRFVWAINSEGQRGTIQSAFHIVIYNQDNGKIAIDSGKIFNTQPFYCPASNLTLESHTNYKWTVQIYDKSNVASSVKTGSFSTGILDETEWNKASWIGIDPQTDSATMNEFRTEFMINCSIQKAVMYIAMPGYYKLWLNEQLIDDHELGYITTFEKRAYYDVVPITHLVNTNSINVIGVMLGNGWWSQSRIKIRPNMMKIIIYMQCLNGDILNIYSNNKDWYQSEGPIRKNDIYDGEWYDATKETNGWLTSDYNYTLWKKASIISNPQIGQLKSSAIMPKAKKIVSYTPMLIWQPSENNYVVNFGQNVAGFAKITIPGNYLRGHNITIKHSEELQPDGHIKQVWPILSPMMFNITLRGDGNKESYQPFFTYFGYQYIEIIGFPGVLTTNDVVSYFIHTDFDTTGSSIQFGPSNINNSFSNANLLNSIQHMTRYAALSNYINIPTDCPTRGRGGWLGDAQLAAETLIYNFDIPASYTKWLLDIKDTQQFINVSGALPEVAPFYPRAGSAPGDPAWTMAYVQMVYYMYYYYGDKRLISVHYKGLKQYMNSMEKELNQSTGLLSVNYSKHGDWDGIFDIDECTHKSSFINTIVWAKQCKLMSILANVIDNKNDYQSYLLKYNNAKLAIYKYYWNKNKNLFIDHDGQLSVQSAQALGLELDILNNTDELTECITNLVYDIQVTHNYHVGTGIVGTKAIWTQLCRYGHCDVALNASIQTTIPGYGWWYIQGATTLWEHWQASRYNSSACGTVGSKNHIMFGSQGSWYYSSVGGIRQKYYNSTNWKDIIIDPYTNCTIFGIYFIQTEVDTSNGEIIVEFEINSNHTDNVWERLNIVIPTGSIATVYIRRLHAFEKYIPIQDWIVTENNKTIYQNMKYIEGDTGILSGNNQGVDTLLFTIESGSYMFTLQT